METIKMCPLYWGGGGEEVQLQKKSSLVQMFKWNG